MVPCFGQIKVGPGNIKPHSGVFWPGYCKWGYGFDAISPCSKYASTSMRICEHEYAIGGSAMSDLDLEGSHPIFDKLVLVSARSCSEAKCELHEPCHTFCLSHIL